jgi:hypothetical protein
MKALDKNKVANISEIISKRVALLITNNSNLKITTNLHQDAVSQFNLIFKNIPSLMFNNGDINLITPENINNIYEALEPYQSSAQKYVLKSLNANQYNLLELARIGASYMILSFINDYYEAIFDLSFNYFYEFDEADITPENDQRKEVALKINKILSSRIQYVIK